MQTRQATIADITATFLLYASPTPRVARSTKNIDYAHKFRCIARMKPHSHSLHEKGKLTSWKAEHLFQGAHHRQGNRLA